MINLSVEQRISLIEQLKLTRKEKKKINNDNYYKEHKEYYINYARQKYNEKKIICACGKEISPNNKYHINSNFHKNNI